MTHIANTDLAQFIMVGSRPVADTSEVVEECQWFVREIQARLAAGMLPAAVAVVDAAQGDAAAEDPATELGNRVVRLLGRVEEEGEQARLYLDRIGEDMENARYAEAFANLAPAMGAACRALAHAVEITRIRYDLIGTAEALEDFTDSIIELEAANVMANSIGAIRRASADGPSSLTSQ